MSRGQHRKNAAQRRAQALEMKQAGATEAQIATDLGYKNADTVATIIRQELRRTPSRSAEQYRTLQTLRLEEAFLVAHHEMVTRKTGWAIDRVLAVHDRIAVLHGLDAPTRVAVHVVTAEAIEEANAKMRGDLEQLPPEERPAIEAKVLEIEGPATDGGPTGSEVAGESAFDVIERTTADDVQAQPETQGVRVAIESGRPRGYPQQG